MMLSSLLVDSHGRVMRDLRVSVTDRCNFRCLYCLPETEEAANFYQTRWMAEKQCQPEIVAKPRWQPRSQLLSFEEIERFVGAAVEMGIEKIRLTGGEPLLRKDLPLLVEKISAFPQVKDLALTTNGFFFKQQARALKDAGLRRVSFSLDSLDRENFKKITGRDGLTEVLEAISLAADLGFNPVKVNAVIIRGLNDHELEALAGFARERGISFRFIEFMPLDSKRVWLKQLVVPGKEILARLQKAFPLIPVESANRSETAKRWRFEGASGEIGLISPVSEPFCGHCNRIRLTADGKIRTCLFSVVEQDLRALLRGGSTDEEIKTFLSDCVREKEDRHHIGEPQFTPPLRTMSCIGG